MDGNWIYQWLQFHTNNWVVVRRDFSGFYIAGFSHKFSLNYANIKQWGPVVNPPIEIPARRHVEETSVQKECLVEKAAFTDNKKAYLVFDPPYKIDNFQYVSSRRPSDCGVVALANIASLSYEAARILCFRHGWSSTKGIGHGFLEVILHKLGFEWAMREQYEYDCLEDLNIVEGIHLVYVHNHVMPFINGRLYNNTSFEKYNIRKVIEIRPLVPCLNP